MKFAIFTYIVNKKHNKSYYSYGAYVREMNLWIKNVEHVIIVAPSVLKTPNIAEIRYQHQKIDFRKIPAVTLLSFWEMIKSILKIPYIFYKLLQAMREANHIHLRCPGNIGLIACIMQVFFPKKPKTTKYAGNWDPKAEQPWSYNLQKWILSNTILTRNMQVLVYGEWPNQTKNIKPFFTASFSEEEKKEVPEKAFEGPYTFLFVGNLVPGKHPLKAIKLVQKINMELNKSTSREARAMNLKIYGDGPEMKMLKAYCRHENLEHLVDFKGSRPLKELKKAYQEAHFLILPSQSEGWPKAVAEAMFFGCIPISTSVSCVPWMLGHGSRGILIAGPEQREENKEKREWLESEKRNVESQEVMKIINLIDDPEEMKRMSQAAKEWSQQYTLERFEGAIKEVLSPQPPEINSGQAPKGE